MSSHTSVRAPYTAPPPRPAPRLDGWKEIAAYLDRGERTVKRWEIERGLPIHRLPGARRGSVHAYRTELDAWLASNSLSETDLPVPAAGESLSATVPSTPFLVEREHGRFLPLLFVSALLLAGVFVWYLHRVQAEKPQSRAANPVSSAESAVSHDLYLKGRFEWNRRTAESLNAALNDFSQSIVHDPGNASAYSGLADTYTLLSEYSIIRDREGYARAIAAARKSVELDDNLPEAHRSLGFAEIWGTWNFRDGERELRRAMQLRPRDPLTHLWYATAFHAPEWYPVASREFDLAQELDPTSTVAITNKSIWLFENGHPQAGLDLARRIEHLDPDYLAPHRYLAIMYWDQRNYPDFLAESRKVADLQRDEADQKLADAATASFHAAGERGLLETLYASRDAHHDDGPLLGTFVAEVCLRLGKTDEAFGLIADDFAHHHSQFLRILTEPDFTALRDDPRYRNLRSLIDYPQPPSTIADLR